MVRAPCWHLNGWIGDDRFQDLGVSFDVRLSVVSMHITAPKVAPFTWAPKQNGDITENDSNTFY
jgi:hypothetical protein